MSSEGQNVQAIRSFVNAELDQLERLEFHAAEVSQLHDQILALHLLLLRSSENPLTAEMHIALNGMKGGLEIVFESIALFRAKATSYLRGM